MKTRLLVIVLALLCAEGKTQSVDEIYRRFTKGYHTYQGLTLPFHLFVPSKPMLGSEYPLVLCLHGAGEKGDDSNAVKNNGMAVVWAWDSNQARWPCFILVPQCPITGSWIYLPGPGSYSTDAIPISQELLTVLDLLDSIVANYSVDTNRIYITGLSMGGFGTWDLIARYPDRFAAAIPMSASGDTSKAALIKNIPIWDFHGADDQVIPVAGSREMMHALEEAGDTVVYTNCHDGNCIGLPDSVIRQKIQAGARVLYTEYSYSPHDIWNRAYNTPFLLPWAFSKSNTKEAVSVHYEVPLSPLFILKQNYPNPFNPVTVISYQLSAVSHVTLRVYDVLGKEVATLVDEAGQMGRYEIRFDGSKLPSGVYFYRLLAEDNHGRYFAAAKKLLLVK